MDDGIDKLYPEHMVGKHIQKSFIETKLIHLILRPVSGFKINVYDERDDFDLMLQLFCV